MARQVNLVRRFLHLVVDQLLLSLNNWDHHSESHRVYTLYQIIN